MNPERILNKYVSLAPVNNDFIKRFGRFRDLWTNTFEPTDRAVAYTDAYNFINPLRREAQRGVRSNLARRGMFRSSLLGNQLNKTKADYDEKRDYRVEAATNQYEREKRDAYDSLMRTYEDDPTGVAKSFKELLKGYK